MLRKSKDGFTIVELSLSIVFIAILALSIVLIILNTISSYRRGLTLNSVNTNGMALVDEMRQSVQNSSSQAIVKKCAEFYDDSSKQEACEKDGASNFVSITRYADVKMKDGTEIKNIPVFGAFCTGKQSYVWNSGYFWEENVDQVVGANKAEIKYAFVSDNTVTEITNNNFRLYRIPDEKRRVCTSVVKTNYNYDSKSFNGKFDITEEALGSKLIELLADDGANTLALYDLNVATPAYNAAKDNLFYSVSFILGTIRGGINIKVNGKSCAAPDNYATEAFDYCAINKFNFAAQAGGE